MGGGYLPRPSSGFGKNGSGDRAGGLRWDRTTSTRFRDGVGPGRTRSFGPSVRARADRGGDRDGGLG